MSSIITSRAQVHPVIQKSIEYIENDEEKKFHNLIDQQVLRKKIKFPILEHIATIWFDSIPEKKQITISQQIIEKHTIGGNVLAGKLLQLRLEKHFPESLKKAVEYIIEGNEWYVCDIIGERVMGHALLCYPEKALPVLKKYARHKNKWIVRCVGVAGHYAIKKGLKKKYVSELFKLLLTLSGETEFHTTRGVGWAAKTTAKFHPDIIRRYEKELKNPDIRTWFHTKINIGLGRAYKYASRYTS